MHAQCLASPGFALHLLLMLHFTSAIFLVSRRARFGANFVFVRVLSIGTSVVQASGRPT